MSSLQEPEATILNNKASAPTPPLPEDGGTLGWHLRRTTTLAVPVILARAGNTTLMTISVAMIGHLGSGLMLAEFGLGVSLYAPAMLMGMALLMGMVVLTSQADGAGRPEECGLIFWVTLAHAVIIGMLCIALSHLAGPALVAMRQDPEIIPGAVAVLRAFSYGMPALLMGTVVSFFLESLGRPMPGMIAMVLANIVNFAFSLLLIDGRLGFPALGAPGAAWATTVVRWLLFFGLLAYLLLTPASRKLRLFSPHGDGWAIGRKLRALGYPMALSQGMESSAFTAASLMCGALGAAQLAAYQVAMNAVTIGFMMAMGLSAAVSIRVGNAIGRRDMRGRNLAGWVATLMAIIAMGLYGAALGFFHDAVAGFYTVDMDVLPIAALGLIMIAPFTSFDGMQTVLAAAIRACGDVWRPVLLQFAAFWIFGIPVAVLFAFHLEMGAPGVLIGLFAATVVAAGLMGHRFRQLGRLEIERF